MLEKKKNVSGHLWKIPHWEMLSCAWNHFDFFPNFPEIPSYCLDSNPTSREVCWAQASQSPNSENNLTREFLRALSLPGSQLHTLSIACSLPICSHVISQRAVKCRHCGLREVEQFVQGHTANVCEFILPVCLHSFHQHRPSGRPKSGAS